MKERGYRRVQFDTDAAVVTRGHCFHGRLKDMSLSGCFIKTKRHVDIGETADITLPLPTTSLSSGIRLKGTAVRVEGSGIAYRINTMDADTFTLLKSILKNKAVMQ